MAKSCFLGCPESLAQLMVVGDSTKEARLAICRMCCVCVPS